MGTVTELVKDLLAGNRLALAQLISRIEERDDCLPELIEALYPHTGKARIWGFSQSRDWSSSGKQVALLRDYLRQAPSDAGSHVTKEVVFALDAAGFEVILIEASELDRLKFSQAVPLIPEDDVSIPEEGGLRLDQSPLLLQEEVADILGERLRRTIAESFKTRSGRELIEQMVKREVNPYRAADIISNQ